MNAKPYQWPEGCEQRRSDYYDEASENSNNSRYLLTEEFTESLGADSRPCRGYWPSHRVAKDIIVTDDYKKFEARIITQKIFYHGEQHVN